MKYDVRNLNLNKTGRDRVEWAYRDMPVLKAIESSFSKKKPLKKINIAACLHVTTETANLLIVLKKAGANVACCASNPLSTQDDVAAHLVKDHGIATFAINGINNKVMEVPTKIFVPVLPQSVPAEISSNIPNNPARINGTLALFAIW